MAKDIANFWDKIARGYAARPVGNEAAYQAKLAHTQSFFTPEARVFEYGCGTGTTALHHAPHVAEIIATDVSEEMLAIAREKLSETDLTNVRFERWNIETDPVTHAGFDVVMAHSILHLLGDRTNALAKTHQMLKPGGIFVSSTVCLGHRAVLFAPLLGGLRLIGKAPPVTLLKRKPLQEEIEAAGFEILPLPEGDWGTALFLTARKV